MIKINVVTKSLILYNIGLLGLLYISTVNKMGCQNYMEPFRIIWVKRLAFRPSTSNLTIGPVEITSRLYVEWPKDFNFSFYTTIAEIRLVWLVVSELFYTAKKELYLGKYIEGLYKLNSSDLSLECSGTYLWFQNKYEKWRKYFEGNIQTVSILTCFICKH